MTDQEAEAQARMERLNAVWALDFRSYFDFHTQTYAFYAVIKDDPFEDDPLGVCVEETRIELSTDFAGYGLTAEWSGFIDEHTTRSEQGGAEFIKSWIPFFRRNCWLSGCAIEATAHEKAQWIQGFSREELESWNLKF